MKQLFTLLFVCLTAYSFAQSGHAISNTAAYHSAFGHSTNKGQALSMNQQFFGMAYYVGGTEVSKSAFEHELMSNPSAYQDYSKGIRKEYAGIAIGYVGSFFCAYGLWDWALGADPNWLLIGGGGAVSLIGGFMESSGVDIRLSAIDSYNSARLSLNFNSRGLGLALNF